MTSVNKFHRCWTETAIKRYFTTEAMAKDKEAFMEVHLPINQIIIDKSYSAYHELGGRQFTDEVGLKNLFLNSNPTQPNRIFSLIGETGSGKSELCQWLYYQIQDELHVPILIRRSMIRLRDIVAEINRHLHEPVPDVMKDITDLWEETVSSQLVAAMFMHLQKPEVLNQISSQDAYTLRQLLDTRDFALKMRQNFVEYKNEMEQLGKVRELNLLPESHFAELVYDAGGLKNPSGCYREMQRAITDCLATTLKVDDLIGKLRRIAAIFKKSGKRPVLLIEDITTFGFLQNDLLDFLFDLASGNFDVMIGITTGFEKANEQQIYKAQQTIRERIEGRFVLTNEHNETLFLREQYSTLAELYLKAVKDNPCPFCEDATFQRAFGTNLYPYNQQFLYNLYSGLQQDGNRKQTPRLYLRALSHTLQTKGMPPFESIEILPIVHPPTLWLAQSAAYSSDLEKLARWYGYNTNQGVFLAKQITEAFNVTVPPGTEISNGYYRFNIRPGGETLPPPPRTLVADASKVMILRVEPREGLASIPNTLRIEGTHLQDGCTVHLGSEKLAIVRFSSSRIQATVPANLIPGVYHLTITNPDGSSGTYSNAYIIKEPTSPIITSIQPSEGDASESNEIYMQGANFENGCVVRLGSNTLNIVRLSATQLRATIPANHSPGAYELTVTNPNGKSTSLVNAYTVKATDLYGQLDQWLDRQGKFPGRAQFKDGVWKLLDLFQFTPFIHQHPSSIARAGAPLIYSRGDRHSQIYLQDSADSLQPGYRKLIVYPEKKFRDLYSQVLALGLGSYKVDDIKQLDHPLLYDWLKSCVDDLQKKMRADLTTGLNMSLQQFILLTKFLLLNNMTGLYEFTPEALAQPLSMSDEVRPFHLSVMGDRPEKLLAWRPAIQALFVAFFHFRDSIVNYPELLQITGQCNPLQALSDLKAIDSKNIYEAYTIGPAKDDYQLRGLVNLVSLYARDLLSTQQGRQLITDPSPKELETIANLCGSTEINPEKLRTQLDKLRQLCTRVGVSWQRQWDLSLQPLDKVGSKLDFQSFTNHLKQLLTRLTQLTPQMNVFVYLSLQREVQTVAQSPEYEIVQTIDKINHAISYFLTTHSSGIERLKDDTRYIDFQKAMNPYLEMAKK